MLFLVLALISAVAALSGLEGIEYWAARICLLIFLLLFIVTATASALKRQGSEE
jgi:uncharacterized membrane protein YtjA (UPF0391 family)